MSSSPVASRCDQSPAWGLLQAHFQSAGRRFDLRQAFAADAGRYAAWTLTAPEVFADLSKNRIDADTMALLLQLARDCGLEGKRDAMLAGEPINLTEGRAVLHSALRAPAGKGFLFSDEVQASLSSMLAFAESVRDTSKSGITDVVHIGIGGSDLGPAMVVRALQAYTQHGLKLHFVSNVDGHDLAPVLRDLKPATTLFVIASKTFTTQETLANALAAKAWFVAAGGSDIARHFVATSSNTAAAGAFGITTTFGFWDWVGGRYSLWSVIGLPIAIAIGAENFRALLAGAHAMDQHFARTPLERNLPVQLGLLDIWYRNFHGFSSRSVAPYHQGLGRLPAYLQQLEMESNGKGVDLEGQTLPYATSPVVWGEAGTNGQHAYFQMLHQGTDVIPVEFIAVKTPNHGEHVQGEMKALLLDQHRKLLANCLAQSQALMQGKSFEEALQESAPTASKELDAATVARHRSFPGNRPSTTLVLDRLTPSSLGALIALYEQRVFVSGALWGINSFDQWGVELGKALCGQLLPRLSSGDTTGLDGSTAGLLKHLLA
ncbi:glucose-6-phosphate isomerase [Roseateles oligotrophus]|uniref:Glucose-6-phosphate isomerase n=1 Tax=Roseateles oligotrophus TaxID=1769250 RepID=A0ABT2YEL2_9BURK|nr:glucose-6-phosphate isomerase [Roseateles oligotrophus]MCV2368497.1 glucose-6-phosphate isomerase [Roseateles oligotrophus]